MEAGCVSGHDVSHAHRSSVSRLRLEIAASPPACRPSLLAVLAFYIRPSEPSGHAPRPSCFAHLATMPVASATARRNPRPLMFDIVTCPLPPASGRHSPGGTRPSSCRVSTTLDFTMLRNASTLQDSCHSSHFCGRTPPSNPRTTTARALSLVDKPNHMARGLFYFGQPSATCAHHGFSSDHALFFGGAPFYYSIMIKNSAERRALFLLLIQSLQACCREPR